MLTLLKLWVTVAILNARSFYFFTVCSLAFGRSCVSGHLELRVYEILVVLGRKVDTHGCPDSFRVEIITIITLASPRKLTANPGQ